MVILDEDGDETFIGMFTNLKLAQTAVKNIPCNSGFSVVRKIDTDKMYFTSVGGIDIGKEVNVTDLYYRKNIEKSDTIIKSMLHKHNDLEGFMKNREESDSEEESGSDSESEEGSGSDSEEEPGSLGSDSENPVFHGWSSNELRIFDIALGVFGLDYKKILRSKEYGHILNGKTIKQLIAVAKKIYLNFENEDHEEEEDHDD